MSDKSFAQRIAEQIEIVEASEKPLKAVFDLASMMVENKSFVVMALTAAECHRLLATCPIKNYDHA